MRTFLLILFLNCTLPLVSLRAGVPLSDVSWVSFKKKSIVTGDTSNINRYTRQALSYVTNPLKVNYLKAYIDSAEMICERESIQMPAMLYLARAEYFFLTNDYNNSMQEASLALKLAKNSGENLLQAKILNFLGRYSLRTGFFKESIDYFNNSNEIARKYRISGMTARNYSGIADVYDALGNLSDYRNSLQKMINAAITENDTLSIQSGYFKLGTSLTGKERNFNRADSLLKAGLDYSLETNDTAFISLALSNMGWNQYLEKNYETALKYYNRALRYSIPSKRYSAAANAFGNIGTIYRDMGENEKSLDNYLKSIEQAEKEEDVYNLSWVYQDMSEMYLRKGDTSNAYQCYVLFKKYSDTHMLKSNTKGLLDARIRYEADTHNKELQLYSLRFRNQRLLIYGYTGLFILTLAIGILIYSRSRINTKRKISEMNRKVAEVTQANLRQQMNPHFIFNTLNSIQYYMYQHDKLSTNNYLTKFSSLMRKVLENSQHTSVPVRDEIDALNLYLDLEKIRFKDKFDYIITIDDEIDPLLYKIPTMLIQPYVENSICHGLMPREGNGLVKIDLKLKKDYILCVIEDNGIGREAAHEKKISCGKNHNSLGTQIISSRLDLVNTLYGTSLKTVYTDLKNDQGDAEGTKVEIHIPIMT